MSVVGGQSGHRARSVRRAPSYLTRLLLVYRHNVGRSLWLTICSPCVHELASLFESVTPAVRLFGLVADDMSQCSLNYLAREAGHITRPIAEACRDCWTI